MPDVGATALTAALPVERQRPKFPLVMPAVGVLLLWMIVPLAMTLYFSVIRYNLLNPMVGGSRVWKITNIC